MTPTSERRKKSIMEWVIPALLGVIGVLVSLGASNTVSAIRDQNSELRKLREELATFRLEYSVRIAKVEQIQAQQAQMETIPRAQRR